MYKYESSDVLIESSEETALWGLEDLNLET